MDEPEVLEDDIDEVAEQLQVLAIVSEERDSAILTEVKECQNRVEALSIRLAENPTIQPESPMLHQIASELSAIRTDLTRFQETLVSVQTQLESARLEPKLTEEPAPVVPPVVEVPPLPTPEPQKKKRRVL